MMYIYKFTYMGVVFQYNTYFTKVEKLMKHYCRFLKVSLKVISQRIADLANKIFWVHGTVYIEI